MTEVISFVVELEKGVNPIDADSLMTLIKLLDFVKEIKDVKLYLSNRNEYY